MLESLLTLAPLKQGETPHLESLGDHPNSTRGAFAPVYVSDSIKSGTLAQSRESSLTFPRRAHPALPGPPAPRRWDLEHLCEAPTGKQDALRESHRRGLLRQHSQRGEPPAPAVLTFPRQAAGPQGSPADQDPGHSPSQDS